MLPVSLRGFTTAALGLVLWCAVPAAVRAQNAGPRVTVSINGSGQTGSTHFEIRSPLRVNQEEGSVAASYAVGSGPALDAGGRVRVWRRLSLGVAVTRFTNKTDALVAAQIPHPLLFNQTRPVTGTASGTTRQELGAHVELAWTIPLTPRFAMTAFAGPSVLQVKQDLVSDVTYSETYPFDTVTFVSAPVSRHSNAAVGYHAGVDLSMRVSRLLALGGIARFSRASVSLSSPLGGVSVDAGGFQAGGGVRLRF